MKIDKIEVARRQIKEAVRLFFNDGDPVAIHTLIAAAHQVLVDVGRSKGIEGALKNAKTLSGPNARTYLQKVNYAFNFFKHADKDPEGSVNIAPLDRLSQSFLFDASILLFQIAPDPCIHAAVFAAWYVRENPDGFTNLTPDNAILKMLDMGFREWNLMTIRQFLWFADRWEQLPPTLSEGGP